MAGEFALIDRFFGSRTGAAAGIRVPIGIGDDCAALQLSPGHLLLTSVDTLNEGIHFFPGTDAAAVGHKALAVNLSDLAACGAKPLACLLALSLPEGFSTDWVAGFANGFRALADAFDCPLIGGDTTRATPGGGISVSVTVFGECPDASCVLRRSGAQTGDDLWVSGSLGGAALAVAIRSATQPVASPVAPGGLAGLLPSHSQQAMHRLDWPAPHVDLGLSLRGIASACIDVSDGLLADLGHILTASGLAGALLQTDALPMDAALSALPEAERLRLTLTGGDDYVLCFTSAPMHRDVIGQCAMAAGLNVYRIGQVGGDAGIRLQAPDGTIRIWQEKQGYEHFG